MRKYYWALSYVGSTLSRRVTQHDKGLLASLYNVMSLFSKGLILLNSLSCFFILHECSDTVGLFFMFFISFRMLWSTIVFFSCCFTLLEWSDTGSLSCYFILLEWSDEILFFIILSHSPRKVGYYSFPIRTFENNWITWEGTHHS